MSDDSTISNDFKRGWRDGYKRGREDAARAWLRIVYERFPELQPEKVRKGERL